MNPCPCGYFGHYNGKCHCTPDQIARYRGKISGALLDRIDIQIEVPAVAQQDLLKQAMAKQCRDSSTRRGGKAAPTRKTEQTQRATLRH